MQEINKGLFDIIDRGAPLINTLNDRKDKVDLSFRTFYIFYYAYDFDSEHARATSSLLRQAMIITSFESKSTILWDKASKLLADYERNSPLQNKTLRRDFRVLYHYYRVYFGMLGNKDNSHINYTLFAAIIDGMALITNSGKNYDDVIPPHSLNHRFLLDLYPYDVETCILARLQAFLAIYPKDKAPIPMTPVEDHEDHDEDYEDHDEDSLPVIIKVVLMLITVSVPAVLIYLFH